MPSDGHELRAVLHEEIGRLPEEYRAPVVLCHLEGMTREMASDRLRCPANMVGVRLMRARERLRPIDFLRNHSMRDGAGSHLDSSWNCLLVADELIRGDRTMALKMGFVRRLPSTASRHTPRTAAMARRPITATVPSDAAGTGFRRPHRTRRPSGPARRARIGRSSRNRARSSASSPAVAYRLPGSFSRHF
jgi:hypothetical protein